MPRIIEAELPDVLAQQVDLFSGIPFRVSRARRHRVERQPLDFGILDESRNASGLIGFQGSELELLDLDATGHIDLLFPKRLSTSCGRAHDERQPVEPTAHRRLALLAFDEET